MTDASLPARNPRTHSTASTPAEPPAFSVVIPAFNAASTVASAVSSVLAQTWEDLEVIVVNDGSTDETAAVLERIADPRFGVLTQTNAGVSAARNRAAAGTRAKYVAFLDSDDLWLPRYLELAHHAIETTPDAGIVYTDAYAFDPVTGKVGKRGINGRQPPVPPPEDPPTFLYEMLQRNFIFSSAIVPRRVFVDVGGFDEALTHAEDYALWLRILTRGYRAAWIPGKHALYRIHKGQASLQRARLASAELQMLDGLRPEDLPTSAHRDLWRQRQKELRHELEVLDGRAKVGAALHAGRRALGRLRRLAGFGTPCRHPPPSDVAAAFPDLTAV